MTDLKIFLQSIQKALSEGKPPKKSIKAPQANGKTLRMTKKDMVLQAIQERSHEIQAEDLPQVEKEMLDYFKEFKNKDYFNDIKSKDYYRLLDLRKKPEARVVVIGDIHCDFKSLAAILIKLSISEYDFFEKGFFVFLGDYLDRGGALFEPLLLLMDLQRILGERMIMLKGNHELIKYDEEKKILDGKVLPLNSVPCLNEYCGKNKKYLKAFGYFYSTLPTYVYLKVADQNILLTHAAIPRQMFLDVFRYDEVSGAIAFEQSFLYKESSKIEESIKDDSLKTKTTKVNDNLLRIRNQILDDMIWGDPCEEIEKYQIKGRFQFGSKQFEGYAQKNKLNRVFRSHEPVDKGSKAFFDYRLYTIFSSGGAYNEQAGYNEVEPAFAVINNNGSYFVENNFLYKTSVEDAVDIYCNLYTEELVKHKDLQGFILNPEFFCSGEEFTQITNLFAKIKEGFPLAEE